LTAGKLIKDSWFFYIVFILHVVGNCCYSYDLKTQAVLVNRLVNRALFDEVCIHAHAFLANGVDNRVYVMKFVYIIKYSVL
jgi:hypothetical protein